MLRVAGLACVNNTSFSVDISSVQCHIWCIYTFIISKHQGAISTYWRLYVANRNNAGDINRYVIQSLVSNKISKEDEP